MTENGDELSAAEINRALIDALEKFPAPAVNYTPPKRLPFRKARKAYLKQGDPGARLIRLKLLTPNYMRFVLPPLYGDDPENEWKAWASCVEKALNTRLPGNWTTARGRKKRRRTLLRYFR